MRPLCGFLELFLRVQKTSILLIFAAESAGEIRFAIYLTVFALQKNELKIRVFRWVERPQGVKIFRKKDRHYFYLRKSLQKSPDTRKSNF